jgi:hypothetical protein
VNFLKKLFGGGTSSNEKPVVKRTQKMQATFDRIEARKQKELQESAEKKRRERSLMTREQIARENIRRPVSAEEELRRLIKQGERQHNDSLQADSILSANSRLDLWHNTIAHEEPPDTIAPNMRIPNTVFNVESNTFNAQQHALAKKTTKQ